ncbi:MAG: peptidoglycan DD-metalloendopeptidase family protein [Xanthomonadales bacterium]|nr:peptidoglycan DD-metalloendopeptidase family protein [Xanthomonadales bacterium]
MRLRALAALSLALAACASFEPRISVESHKPSSGAQQPGGHIAAAASVSTGGYVVARGDTLYGIAFRNKLDFRDLAAWNRIAAPYTIYPGQQLRLSAPTPSVQAAAAAAPAPAAAAVAPQVEVPAPPAPVTAVEDGDDVQTFAVRDDPAPAAAGGAQPLLTQPVPPPTSSPAAAIGLAPTTPQPQPVTPVPSEPVPVPVPAAAAPSAVDTTPRPVQDPNAPSREREGLRWRWPVSGALIGRFVEGDPTQQGIDLGGSLGNPVLAAADGEVVYSGNGLLGYGELVIVQHNPGFLSAYGHNQKRLVLEGARVRAGQPIAEMGRRGGIDMLHFEIRRNGKPVDPLGYLPQR